MRESLTRSLTFRYVGALLVVAGLLVAGQLLVQRALDRQQGHARVVNLAGRQRMLSQRACLLLLAHREVDARAVVDEWDASQRTLATRDNSPAIAELFAELDADQHATSAAARAGDVVATCARTDAFLAGMDRIVAEYEREARERVVGLRGVELVLLGLALAVLALEGLFVFRPAVRALRVYLAERDRAERELVRVTDREQQRLAHDLHDGLGQHLVGTSYLVEAMRPTATEAQREQLAEIGQLLTQAIEQSRGLARGLYPAALETEGLAAALRDLAARTERTFGVTCRVEVGPDGEPPATARGHLYRIASEAVANAAKHARGQTIEIACTRAADRLVLSIRDDGVGIAAHGGDGLGLHMMEYRANMLGAVLDVSAGDERGTVVTCTLTIA